MSFFSDPEFLARWVGIVLLDICLAGDNALVIAMATRTLPPKQQFWGRMWGTLGAVILRVGFIYVVTWLLRVPLLQFVGGLALVWIAVKLVRPGAEGDGENREGGTLRARQPRARHWTRPGRPTRPPRPERPRRRGRHGWSGRRAGTRGRCRGRRWDRFDGWRRSGSSARRTAPFYWSGTGPGL